MAVSDKVFIVGEMTVPGLRRARVLADAAEHECGASRNVSVIINKEHRGWFGGSSLKRSDAKKVLGGLLAGFVPYEETIVREAIDRGLPLYEIKSSNEVDKELAPIVMPR